MSQPWVAALCGFAVAAASALIAWLGLRWSESNPRLMIAAVLGGTLVRMVMVGAVSVLLLLFTSIDSTIYVVTLAVCYLLFLGVEIYLIASRAKGASGSSTAAEQASE
ncbi:MAG: hypothetical protein HOH74_13770 [Gemmatimonadetes bacterium]|nr:hypothetical protein [Gemmatimonadota bacterium]MBT6146499.1 hypothetical protein [Gemmatimonadota bacterium]